VNHSMPEKCSGMLVLLAFVPMFCVAPPVAAEIFKCVAKNGGLLYQNFPCEFDSIGWVPPTPRGLNVPTPATDRTQATAKAMPVSIASAAKWSNATEARVGMTPEEVRAIWGEPMEIVHEETAGSRVEIWRYDDNSSVHFDHRNRVVAVER
jgi:hypothetical protein